MIYKHITIHILYLRFLSGYPLLLCLPRSGLFGGLSALAMPVGFGLIAVHAAGALLALTVESASAAAPMLKKGDAAPAFTLKGSDGKTYKLSQFKGKKAVVIAWFPKAFTGG